MDTDSVENKSSDPFYEDAVQYWEKIPPTISGMLGGFGYISKTDIEGSKMFLNQIFSTNNAPSTSYAVDCGAGIGRITKNLLIHVFDCVDLVEQNPAFLQKARQFIGTSHKEKLGELYAVGLQNFVPQDAKYDVIWCQWVMGHLKDEHFVEFLERCKKGLKHNGMLIIKENITSSGEVEMDEGDSSVTRPPKLLHKLFKSAGLVCLKETEQSNFPKGLYAVRMFALRPERISAKEIVTNDLKT
ncbi:N-terminal methyltransferase [Carabus blaptoides fortunei]